MKELINKIVLAEKNGFDFGAWMVKNFNFEGNRKDAIELLSQKERYKNLENDAEFIKALEEKEGGEQE